MAVAKKGEWYWTAKCPTCGQLVAHSEDASKGAGDTKPAAPASTADTSITCPKGHKFDVATEQLLRLEWGAE